MLDSLKQEYDYEELEIEDQFNSNEAIISDCFIKNCNNGNQRNTLTISFITVGFKGSKC
jgi:hypothetical protein